MTHAPRFLHVANGTSTTMSIEASGIGGTVSIWADPLYEGPVPGGISDEALLDVRASFHSNPDDPASTDPVNDLRRWRDVIDASGAYDELVLWYEHDLFDQLNLVQLLGYIRAHVPAGTPVSLVCIGSFPGRPQFKGLGELPPEVFPGLLAQRERIGDAQYAAAEQAWDAFRAPSPLNHRRPAARRHTGPAVSRPRAAPPARGVPGHGRRAVAHRAPPAAVDRARTGRTRRRVPPDARRRARLLHHRHLSGGARALACVHLAAAPVVRA